MVERCWKWAKRRPAIAALLSRLAVTVLTGLTAVTWQWRAAVAARDEARQTLKMANEAVNTSFKEVSEDYLLHEPGMHPCEKSSSNSRSPTTKPLLNRRPTILPALKVQLANAFFRWGMITGEIGSKEEAKQILSTAIGHFRALLRSGSHQHRGPHRPGPMLPVLALEAVRSTSRKTVSNSRLAANSGPASCWPDRRPGTASLSRAKS